MGGVESLCVQHLTHINQHACMLAVREDALEERVQ